MSEKALDAILDARLSAEHILAFLVVAGFSYNVVGKGVQLETSHMRKDGTFSRSTQKTCKYFRLSNASAKAVELYAGINWYKAKSILRELCELSNSDGQRVLFSYEEWNAYARSYPACRDELDLNSVRKKPKTLPSVVNQKDNKESVRFVLNNFNENPERQIRLPHELVSGIAAKSPRGALSL